MMDFLLSNWLWIGFIVLMVVMHRSGHGCGMHASHGRSHDDQQVGNPATDADPAETTPARDYGKTAP